MSMEEEEFGSDTDDDDYTPDDGPAASEEENSGDEEAPPAAEGAVVETKKVRKKKAVMATGRGGMFEEGGDRIDWGAEQEKERKEVSEEVEKKKSEDIWADFKKDTGGSTARTKPAGSGLGSLASLAAPSPAQAPQAKPKSRFGSIFESVEKEKKPEVDKVEEAVKEKPKSRFSSLFDTNSSSSKAEGEEPPKAATAPGDKVEITKEFDFAGEVVKVSKQVAADSREAAKFLAAGTTTSTTKRPGGLAGVVGSIGKKQKMGCLDKSKLDWNSFVEENQMREELTTHNKGKDGYVEKLEFLERADLRQFEQEKAVREKTRKSLMK